MFVMNYMRNKQLIYRNYNAAKYVIIFVLSICTHLSAMIQEDYVTETYNTDYFTIADKDAVSPIYVDKSDFAGVLRAANDLQTDIQRVTGKKPQISNSIQLDSEQVIVVGTLGKSRLIDSLLSSNKIDHADLKGKLESYVIQTVDNPFNGIKKALVIAGSDKRGTIYGIYDLSEKLGVSPWYWWADVPVKKCEAAYVIPGRYNSGQPKVKYRGIFINDEEPCFGPWAREKFGGINSKMYVHMFELILRLRGNYLWPAMWGKSIYEDDPESARLADLYGVVLGTSHHEPMTRAHVDWSRHKDEHGNGQWNYETNEEGLKKFWTEGIRRNINYETLITIGMRGDGDTGMDTEDGLEAGVKLMERIVADQRTIIANEMNTDPTKVPQMWALYKEVTDFYEHGMRVPDDVTLLWCDDNWGNNRRLPTPQERKRTGGAGIYYHFDYVGSPRCYKWLNTNPLPKIWEQMNMAYRYDADMIWVVNVGDLKPMEVPIEFFLTMAWNPDALPKEKINEFTYNWARREFGTEYAESIANIVSNYAKYNGWRKPELLEPDTFSLVNYQEAERVLAAWHDIVAEAARINKLLDPEYRDAFFQLVLYPAKASAVVAELYIAAGQNQLYARQGRASTNEVAKHARRLFELDQELTDAYHKVADGKWNHMMAQTRIGYTNWRDPQNNIIPKVSDIDLSADAIMGVAIEGSVGAWPGESKPAILPDFDSINNQKYWIDIFKRGIKDFEFSVKADKPWVKLSETSGTVNSDHRIWVCIDWNNAPVGNENAVLTISRESGESVNVNLKAISSDKYTVENTNAFGGLAGPIAFNVESAVKNISAGNLRWEKIPDYGRGPSGMTVFPVLTDSVMPPENSPCLEYPVFFAKSGDMQIDIVTGVALKVQPDRGVRFAVSIDNQVPQILDLFKGQSYADPSKRGDTSAPPIKSWHTWVKDNAITINSSLNITSPGVHTLKIWMVDPGIVLQKIIIHDGNLPKSYFGPPAASMN